MPSANEIRQQFIDFFCKKHGHTFVPSSSVVPLDDPTLLFANAGMNQFKPYFLGTEKPPYQRVANTQKCIRAGGKHNDLDDVGKDTYHHTFFEMLGNWSFGDYFKKEAIQWAWELLTDVWKLDKSRLHVTVFEGDAEAKIPRDDEAAGFWRAVGVADAHIHLGNKKDNFWEMGETGPCGPCTEIHYDNTPDLSGAKLVNKGTADVIEIWNLVFIQFNRNPDKSLTPLPAKHVDTGMGFERVTKVLQGKTSNYDTDVFTPIFAAIQKVTGEPPYGGRLDDIRDTAYRVIADHIRALTFALADGAVPDREGRGYVIRNILRRAQRYGWQYLRREDSFLHKLVPTVVEVMGTAFPELKSNVAKVCEVIEDEEESFLKTLGRGFKRFENAAVEAIADSLRNNPRNSEVQIARSPVFPPKLTFRTAGQLVEYPFGQDEQRAFVKQHCLAVPIISGKTAFDLHTEQGLYIDIQLQIASERDLSVDVEEYQRLFAKFQEESGKDRKVVHASAIHGDLPTTDDSPKYNGLTGSAVVISWIKDNVVSSGRITAGDQVGLVLDKTNFYAEQGGQVGDAGLIKTDTGSFDVEDTQRLGDSVIHLGKVVEGTIKTGQKATLEVSPERLDTMRHHTTTHLLNWALRKVLGDHIDQKGSSVKPEEFTFDFSHPQKVTKDEMEEVERLVNEQIRADLRVTPVIMPLARAKTIAGVRALFGEKYPDPVRVVLIGAETLETATTENAIEFCGGTHLNRTGEAGYFMIYREDAVAKGVRRLTCFAGRIAVEQAQRETRVLMDLADEFSCKWEQFPARVRDLQEKVKKLEDQLKKGAVRDLAGTFDNLLASASKIGDVTAIVGEIPAGPDDAIRTQVDRIKQKAGSSIVVVGWIDGDKVGLLAAATDDVIKRGIKAGDLIKQIAPIVGGGGGGRPNMAQAGGKEPAKLAEALTQARRLLEQQLTK